MKALFLDIESTGNNINEDQPIEICGISSDLSMFHKYYKPTTPIKYGAQAIHNIHIDELQEELEVDSTEFIDDMFFLFRETSFIIGHNIDFDVFTILNNMKNTEVSIAVESIPRIDTLCLSRALFPEVDSHTQGAMLYYFLGKEAKKHTLNAHGARADVLGNMILYKHLCHHVGVNPDDFEKMYKLSEEHRIPKIMPFGKHKGEAIKDIPLSYKSWLLKQDNVDPYLIKALSL